LDFDNWKFNVMVPQQKIDQVNKLREKAEKAAAVYMVNYRGLSGNQMVELRKKIREAGGHLEIAKNTLLLRAMEAGIKNYESKIKKELAGPTAVLWAEDDQLAPLKAVVKFSQDAGVPSLKMGLLEDRVLSAEEVETLAKLPEREALLGQVVGMLHSPTSRLVWALKGNLQKLVLVVGEVQKSRK
jgi:large subunit ribosomal protein L10